MSKTFNIPAPSILPGKDINIDDSPYMFPAVNNGNVIAFNHRGESVLELQAYLIKHGLRTEPPTSHFDEDTYQQVKTFQSRLGLKVDGLVGIITASYLFKEPVDIKEAMDDYAETLKLIAEDKLVSTETKNKPKIGITQAQYEQAAKEIGIDVAFIKAIEKLESRGAGFLPNGLPTILFERHQFFKHLSKQRGAAFTMQVSRERPDICNRTPGGYLGGRRELTRHRDAIRINETAALMAASYGRYQIMGFNHELCGFKNVKDFVLFMEESEYNHLICLLRFIKNNPTALKAAKELNFAKFAAAYNGIAYRKNKYDTKLQKAYYAAKATLSNLA